MANDGSKTQMALEFAYRRYVEDRCPVFWVHADNYEKFMQGYQKIANTVRLSAELQGEDMKSYFSCTIELVDSCQARSEAQPIPTRV